MGIPDLHVLRKCRGNHRFDCSCESLVFVPIRADLVQGYAGRIMMWKNPFELNPFLIQICCLTIAPAFLCAGIYLCLARMLVFRLLPNFTNCSV